MAFLEWRRFNFFELIQDVDNGKIAETLKDRKITASTSGHGHLVFGDSEGNIHLVSRLFHVTSFRAHELTVNFAEQLRHSAILVTVGSDEPGINPVIKVWNLDKTDKQGHPTCVRISRAIPNNKPENVTALCVHENLNLMAVGFNDGSVILYRGDITRERTNKTKVLKDGNATVTGLAFRTTSKLSHLFVVTTNSLFLYNITVRDKEQKVLLDSMGCSKKCSVFADASQDSHFMISRNDAVYCYTPDGRGPCYAVEGEKIMLQWFRSYLVIVAKETKTITAVSTVSPKIAKSQQYDSEGLVDIFRQYGDHLYAKGDHNAAIEQYIKTIGKLEPSYVIRKFLDSQHIDKLTTYLQALHKQGLATEDHTTLLLNCYTKLNNTEKLKEFIMTKDREVDFDVEIAIKVCRQVSREDALMLAKKHGMHSWYLKIQIEDLLKYKEALEYIGSLEFEEAESNMKKYGNILIQHAPDEATQFLKRLCTDYRPSNKPLVDQSMLDGSSSLHVERANPEDFIHLFLNNSERLVEFLEHLVKVHTKWSTLVYNTLIEHYLHLWESLSDVTSKCTVEQKVVRLLQNSEANYDKDQTLILCQIHNFRSGILYLYEEGKLYQQILQYHIRQRDYKAVLTTCRRFGQQDPSLWVQALWACTKDSETPSDLLGEVLSVIEKQRLLSPLLVVDALASSGTATIGDVRSYLLSVLQTEKELTEQEQQLINKYRQETDKIRQQIQSMQTSAVVFQASRCSACNHQLELPSVHFLCQHSYHQHCFQSFAENENECPACLPDNKKILDIIKSQEQSRDLHEIFHSQLERAEDGFSLVADYFGRGVFNKLTLITDSSVSEKPSLKPSAITQPETTLTSGTYSTVPEGRLRLHEGKPSKTFVNGLSNVIPEGRMRLDESKRSDKQYSSSLEANLTQPADRTPPYRRSPVPGSPAMASHSLKSTPRHSPSARATPPLKETMQSQTPRNPFDEPPSDVSKNPFDNEDDEEYDASKNPFVGNDPTNPFLGSDDDAVLEDDDYDKNLNPFAT
ncbi:vacuolar protein sorting-associated protein 11 homolog isoform X3 [Schistocerca piceifrons]|uniref:vacuolar protein sorting-associated protein 11 homolog isoform X3 n=1 Tax=Schistocerca piceifrons TaxID=274613 RepID=UPI001F5F9CD7|nr:vacuolar protein sorting-associated protein 11 homolog isoform X3 [Schistocerca piceifrons]